MKATQCLIQGRVKNDQVILNGIPPRNISVNAHLNDRYSNTNENIIQNTHSKNDVYENSMLSRGKSEKIIVNPDLQLLLSNENTMTKNDRINIGNNLVNWIYTIEETTLEKCSDHDLIAIANYFLRHELLLLDERFHIEFTSILSKLLQMKNQTNNNDITCLFIQYYVLLHTIPASAQQSKKQKYPSGAHIKLLKFLDEINGLDNLGEIMIQSLLFDKTTFSADDAIAFITILSKNQVPISHHILKETVDRLLDENQPPDMIALFLDSYAKSSRVPFSLQVPTFKSLIQKWGHSPDQLRHIWKMIILTPKHFIKPNILVYLFQKAMAIGNYEIGMNVLEYIGGIKNNRIAYSDLLHACLSSNKRGDESTTGSHVNRIKSLMAFEVFKRSPLEIQYLSEYRRMVLYAVAKSKDYESLKDVISYLRELKRGGKAASASRSTSTSDYLEANDMEEQDEVSMLLNDLLSLDDLDVLKF